MQLLTNIIIGLLTFYLNGILYVPLLTHYLFLSSDAIDNRINRSNGIDEFNTDRNDLNVVSLDSSITHDLHGRNNYPRDSFNVKDYCFVTDIGKGEPIQLVSPTDDHLGFELNHDALEIINNIPKPIAVVGVIGSINSGKSFFLNVLNEHLLCNNSTHIHGFEVSDSPNPKTQGIWAWSIPLKVDYIKFQQSLGRISKINDLFGKEQHIVSNYISIIYRSIDNKISTETLIDTDNPAIKHVNLILLDVEGFNSPYSTRNYDESLFSIVATLSSELVCLTNRTIDAHNLADLHSHIRSFNLFNIRLYSQYLKLFNDFDTTLDVEDSSTFKDYSNKDENCMDVKRDTVETLLDMMKNKSLTIVVQDYIHDLNTNSLTWLHSLLTSFRHDLTVGEIKEYMKETDERTKIISQKLSEEKNQNGNIGNTINMEDIDNLANNYTRKLSSQYKYNFQYLFNSVDCILLPMPTDLYNLSRLNRINKADLYKKFLIQLTSYKVKLLSRAFRLPKRKLSSKHQFFESKQMYSLMSGADLTEMLKFLVHSVNNNLSQNVEGYIKEFKLTRMSFYKNDLSDVYKSELLNFISKPTLPLHLDLFEFNKNLIRKIDLLFSEHIENEIPEADSIKFKDEMVARSTNVYSEVSKFLSTRLENYCVKHVTNVKQEIDIEYANIVLPMIPSRLLDFLEVKKKVYVSKCIKAINVDGILYSESDSCLVPIKDLNDYIDTVSEQIKTKNREVLEGKFEYAYNTALECYNKNSDPTNTGTYHISIKEFKNLLHKWDKDSLDTFNLALSEFITIEFLYHTYITKLNKRLTDLQHGSLSEWSKMCWKASTDIIDRYSATYKGMFLELTSLPDTPFVLHIISTYIKFKALKELHLLYCRDSSIFVNIIKEFNRKMNELFMDISTQNYESILSVFSDDLTKIQAELRKVAESFYLWYSFRRYASKLAHQAIFKNDAIFSKTPDTLTVLKGKLNIDDLSGINLKLLSKQERLDYRILENFVRKGAISTTREDRLFKDRVIRYWITIKLAPEFSSLYYGKMIHVLKIATSTSLIIISSIGVIFCAGIYKRLFCSLVAALGCSSLLGFKVVCLKIHHALYNVVVSSIKMLNYVLEFVGIGYTFLLGFLAALILIYMLYRSILKRFKTRGIIYIETKANN